MSHRVPWAGRAMRSGGEELGERSRLGWSEYEPSCSSMRGDSRSKVARGRRTAGGTIWLRSEPQHLVLRKRELRARCRGGLLGGTARLVLTRRAVRGEGNTHAEAEPGACAHTALTVSPVECCSLRSRRRPPKGRDRHPFHNGSWCQRSRRRGIGVGRERPPSVVEDARCWSKVGSYAALPKGARANIRAHPELEAWVEGTLTSGAGSVPNAAR